MKLRFIGKDGSMGLANGKVYTCDIKSIGDIVYVDWYSTFMDEMFLDQGFCPYSSLAKALENWEEVSNL